MASMQQEIEAMNVCVVSFLTQRSFQFDESSFHTAMRISFSYFMGFPLVIPEVCTCQALLFKSCAQPT